MKNRLSPGTFDIPAAEMRRGYRAAIYFSRAKRIAAHDSARDARRVLMQVFQKKDAVLCGIDEAVALLKIGAGRWLDDKDAERVFDEYMKVKLQSRGAGRDHRYVALKQMLAIDDELDNLWVSEWNNLEVDALYDGDTIEPWETVMHINGRYSSFAHLESVYLGVLARRTLIASNVRRTCQAANGKQVLFFADRFDHWSTQGGDGYAARIGGASGVASDAMSAWWGEQGMGTMPHALIAFYDGDTTAATAAFQQWYPDTNLIALVDFNNDCVGATINCVNQFGDALWGVRLDTSETMVDRSIAEPRVGSRLMGDFQPTGVNPALVDNVRVALDQHGREDAKIIVSGGFNPDKIAYFEKLGVPVDAYAVGSSLLRGSNDFTADIVQPVPKRGRFYRSNERLERVS